MPRRRIALLLTPLALAGCLTKAAWLPDGAHVAYLRAGALWITDLDGRHTRVADAPSPDATVLPAPAGDLIALAGTFDGVRALKAVDRLGNLRWSITLPGGDAVLLPGAWSPRGDRVAIRISTGHLMLCDISSGVATRVNARGGPARFLADGTLVWLAGDGAGRWRLEGRERVTGFAEPKGDDAEPLWLTADATRAWWRVRIGAQAGIVLAGPDGTPVFRGDRMLAAAGPDPDSYVTGDGGYALIRPGAPAINLNPFYNRILKMDLAWALADPKAAAEPYQPRDLLASGPAFSPDGKRFAILTPRLLAVGRMETGEVVALAKW
jgi:hypothetical protein